MLSTLVVSKPKLDEELPAPLVLWKSCGRRGFSLLMAERFVALTRVCSYSYQPLLIVAEADSALPPHAVGFAGFCRPPSFTTSLKTSLALEMSFCWLPCPALYQQSSPFGFVLSPLGLASRSARLKTQVQARGAAPIGWAGEAGRAVPGAGLARGHREPFPLARGHRESSDKHPARHRPHAAHRQPLCSRGIQERFTFLFPQVMQLPVS